MHSIVLLALACLATAQTNFSILNFSGTFAAGSGVLQSLRATAGDGFDFSPSDVFHLRNNASQYHTGDLTFRYRAASGASEWATADTSTVRLSGTASEEDATDLLLTNLNQVLPNISHGLQVSRTWRQLYGDLVLEFTISNDGADAVELGSLGMPIEMNNIFSTRTAVQTMNKCVLVDPYIGLHAGYAQATRLTGTGPALVITPLNKQSKFEAWRFLEEPEGGPLGYQVQTYEGNYAWEIFSKAWAENEWKDAQPWNSPTSETLNAGENITVGLRFSVADKIQHIEDTVSSVEVPVAVGIPGYVVPHDLTAKLFLHAPEEIASILVEPADSLHLSPCGEYGGQWVGYDVQASESVFGRARAVITYNDGTTQAVHYWIANSSPQALSDFGNFLTTDQWYTNTPDPFGRAPSVITYNRESNEYVLQDNRTWIAGLSDEGGAGSFLAAGMKQAYWPVADEVSKLEQFVDEVVWGRLQIDSGNETHAVRKSLFYYEPELAPGYEYDDYFNWTGWSAWDREAAYLIDRTYDYVHVSALYWSLYRAGRTHPGLLQTQDAQWYLKQAYHTVAFSVSNSTDDEPHTGYWQVGLIGEWCWGSILADLKAEGYNDEAAHLEDLMLVRQRLWASVPDPFGSEMAWDSTGEEGVYYWSNYFNDSTTANKSVNVIRGYMPSIPHWGYNGNARRYWDFLYAGDIKLARIERQIHHYGSGLNSLPTLDNYRSLSDPENLEALYELRIGYGGNQGPLSNIDAGGFGSMAFHSYADTLHWDAYSGDYGPNFLGHVFGSATYLVNHPIFGYLGFGGNVNIADNVVTVQPRDAVRKRIFIAPISLWIELDAGVVEAFTYDNRSHQVRVSIGNGLSVEQLGAPSITLKFTQTVEGAAGCKMELTSPNLQPRLDGWAVDAPAVLTFSAS